MCVWTLPTTFQSTPSVWRETIKCVQHYDKFQISIHSLRVEGDCVGLQNVGASIISIHSLRVEGDADGSSYSALPCISIHSLRVEGDPCRFLRWSVSHVPFQSTPSVWRETLHLGDYDMVYRDFNPLPPCGGRHASFALTNAVLISIHSLRVEGDKKMIYVLHLILRFQSTPSVWRETTT